MKNKKKNLMFGFLLLFVFAMGFITNIIFNNSKTNTITINETELLITSYSDLPNAIDSIEKLSIGYYDTANVEMLHYVRDYNIDSSYLPDYYVTNFGDTIAYNKDNFYYYVALYTVAENLLATRKHIINGLLLNVQMEQMRNKEED